ncbi:triphosphoribosyl-dephospho-CoA synthase MdcB [Agrobacterium sp. rho-13.3]|uniref:triphosphoribosyl-dephospho-CoA synthase MdcB n=1 Tax=Agrobacterium sp. rho-13.3 TaxID=3072980 RepID=UPI002A17845C|nr:triphosphoribosyl-dephospho-CoA synthase MdcB [Agrobacterium sp. rho-13.3]MDX8308478.1 triphosphoribosyl-dephospho-CoA synthase MdcB [Agrobacterium sp. rho-13.3]
MTALLSPTTGLDTGVIGQAATLCLKREIATYPKPGLVSPVDSGAHHDMDAEMMNHSADVLEPFFARLAEAGAAGAEMDRLRSIGIEAERAMMIATGGVNTHRGAIFGMGLLCAAAGFRARYAVSGTLGRVVAHRWGADIVGGPVHLHSHGSKVARQHGAGGARAEAAAGFPSLYTVAIPALQDGRRLAPLDTDAAQVHALMTLVARVTDTNLLYRGGLEGLRFAQEEACAFLEAGGCVAPEWYRRAVAMHHAFVARRLSPGGCADLLGMALFVELQES